MKDYKLFNYGNKFVNFILIDKKQNYIVFVTRPRNLVISLSNVRI